MGEATTYRASLSGVEVMDIEADTLDEATLQLPDGAYTVVPIFEGWRVVRLDRHLARTVDTTHLLGIESAFDPASLREVLRRCVSLADLEMARLRLTLPGGEPDTAYVSVVSWQPPDETLYTDGVRVVTADLWRENPRAKNTTFVRPRSDLLDRLPEDIYEAILCGPDGALLEGSSTNFYAVLDGRLRTADEGMLVGVTRSIVLDACAQEPLLPLDLEPVSKGDLAHLDEAMLSSVSRGVVPIVEIDGAPVGEGVPGPLFAELHRRYGAIFERELEPL